MLITALANSNECVFFETCYQGFFLFGTKKNDRSGLKKTRTCTYHVKKSQYFLVLSYLFEVYSAIRASDIFTKSCFEYQCG